METNEFFHPHDPPVLAVKLIFEPPLSILVILDGKIT